MRILRVADIPDNRTGGMSRFMHATSDEMRAMGHEVDLGVHRSDPSDVRGPLRRFAVPVRIVQLVRERLRAGARYDVVDVHEPLAGAYAVARRLDASLPPLLVVSHGIEHRGHELALAYMKKKGLPTSLKSRLSPYSVIAQADLALKLADQIQCAELRRRRVRDRTPARPPRPRVASSHRHLGHLPRGPAS